MKFERMESVEPPQCRSQETEDRFVWVKSSIVRMSQRHQALGSLVPRPIQRDRLSILESATDYIKELKVTIKELEQVKAKRCNIERALSKSDASGESSEKNNFLSNIIGEFLEKISKMSAVSAALWGTNEIFSFSQRKGITGDCYLYIFETKGQLTRNVTEYITRLTI